MSFYTDEELTRCNEQGCNNPGIPPDYIICMEHYQEMKKNYKEMKENYV